MDEQTVNLNISNILPLPSSPSRCHQMKHSPHQAKRNHSQKFDHATHDNSTEKSNNLKGNKNILEVVSYDGKWFALSNSCYEKCKSSSCINFNVMKFDNLPLDLQEKIRVFANNMNCNIYEVTTTNRSMEMSTNCKELEYDKLIGVHLETVLSGVTNSSNMQIDGSSENDVGFLEECDSTSSSEGEWSGDESKEGMDGYDDSCDQQHTNVSHDEGLPFNRNEKNSL
ncbi:hypothetical protein HELRODRAFT_187872 [Helobdella robusta]|uniref:Uncharacterized protein n=1 Tax=Helobdella robusta TaxID=6412 RepID=T1FPF8_HELRO|nr:hypothetical protein HELRODRAFT_187872 [Helobdella robusta]ESO12439.1 hypothetical protein HELRODRAFT_187872 [Helobdella robusta]